MRVLFGDRWLDGFADAHRAPRDARVEVLAACSLERLTGIYPEKPRDPHMVWNYLREIGPRDTLRKVLSRSRERFRNAKFVSCGFGRVLEAPRSGSLAVGDAVVFMSPIGPACAERLVLTEELLEAIPREALPVIPEDAVLHVGPREAVGSAWWAPLRGWNPESRVTMPPLGLALALKEARSALDSVDWSTARRLPRSADPVRSVLAPATPCRARSDRPRAVLFGYGNYAKTIILPRVRPYLEVERVHEIDATQIPPGGCRGIVWDTAPELAPGDRPDAVFVAGYHHSHADLAAAALRRGAAAVIEKPLATTRAQLHRLLAAMRESDAPVFSGFQRRYLPFNELARRDLGVRWGDPISYQAIVYEVPLPALHWYRWPSSRSRLLSNGCHWLDHFLYLNDWAPVSEYDLSAAPDGSLNTTVVLENGAFFTMVLTDRGSRRLGVRDHVELRAGDATVTIEDGASYRSENGRRVLRSRRINRLDAYRIMYAEIARRVAAREPGDSLVSVQRSASLALDLEDRLENLSLPQTLGVAAPRARPLRRLVAAH